MYYDHELENRSRNIPIKGPTSNDETEVLEPNEDQYSFPLIKDCLETKGMQQSSVLSCLDIRDAFFSIKLAEKSQKF